MKDNERNGFLRSRDYLEQLFRLSGHYWETVRLYRIRGEYVENRKGETADCVFLGFPVFFSYFSYFVDCHKISSRFWDFFCISGISMVFLGFLWYFWDFYSISGIFFYFKGFAQKVIKKDSMLNNSKNKICCRQLARHVTCYNGYQANLDFREC